MSDTDTKHMEFLRSVAEDDVAHLELKERTYGGSWKKRGGVGAFMMMARKWDRLENMLKANRDPYLFNYDVFAACGHDMSGADGSPLAEIRDLRRYLLLVEAEMLARTSKVGIVAKIDTNLTEQADALNAQSFEPEIVQLAKDFQMPETVLVDVVKLRQRYPLYESVDQIASMEGGGIFGRGIHSWNCDATTIARILRAHDATQRLVPRPAPASDSNRHADRVRFERKFLISNLEFESMSQEDRDWYVSSGDHAWLDRRKLKPEQRDLLGRFPLTLSEADWRQHPDFSKELYLRTDQNDGTFTYEMRTIFRELWGK